MTIRATNSTESGYSLPPALLQELELALRSIRFGEIQLVVHNGRVVQLEKREKVRLQTDVTPQ